MAKVTKSASRSIYIASEPPYQGSMTAWALRDFVRALDEHQVPDNAKLDCHRDHGTLRFTGVSVRVTTAIDESTPVEPTGEQVDGDQQ